MYPSDEKPKNEQKAGIFISNNQLMVAGVVLLLFAGGILFYLLQSPVHSGNQVRVTVDSAEGWQSTGLRLSRGQFFTVQYYEGSWRISSQDPTRYGLEGGAAACAAVDCAEPLANYTKSGMIARIGSGDPFPVGRLLEMTADDSGMLQLRINDGSTSDNEGVISVLVSLGN